MLEHLLSDVICITYLKERTLNPGKAMLIDFSSKINYDTEEGYRHRQLLLYAPRDGSYIQVWQRETWDVIALEDTEDSDDDDGEMVPKRGKGYTEGASEWKLMSYHDTCWRSDGVQRFVQEHSDKLMVFSGLGKWYEFVDPPPDWEELLRQQRR